MNIPEPNQEWKWKTKLFYYHSAMLTIRIITTAQRLLWHVSVPSISSRPMFRAINFWHSNVARKMWDWGQIPVARLQLCYWPLSNAVHDFTRGNISPLHQLQHVFSTPVAESMSKGRFKVSMKIKSCYWLDTLRQVFTFSIIYIKNHLLPCAEKAKMLLAQLKGM